MTRRSPADVTVAAVKPPVGPRPALPLEYTCEWDRADLRIPGEARRSAHAALTAWGAAEVADDVALVVSELVANAVLHGTPPVSLSLRLDPRPTGTSLSGEVRDTGPAAPAHIPAATQAQIQSGTDALAESGRGLALATALTAQLGTARRDGASTVWFRLPVPGGPSRGRTR